MRRAALLALLLGRVLAAGEKAHSLKELLDPQHPDFALGEYTWEDWETLDEATKLRARGTDPAEWETPPPEPETPEEKAKREEREKRDPSAKRPGNRVPGFRFDRRLEAKRKAFEELLGAASAPKLEGLVKQLKLLDKELARYEKVVDEARDEYFQVAEQLHKATEAYSENYRKKHGTWPESVPVNTSLLADYNKKSIRLQRILALRQSELQFHDWLVGRVGELVAALTEAEAAKPLAALAAGMADKDLAYRIRCAELLARLQGGRAQQLYEKALAQEEDPLLLAELVRVRARWGGPGAYDLLAKRLDDPGWPVRAAVVRELARIPRRESVDLLVARLAKEDGRLRDDIAEALRALTGRNFLPEPDPWRIWWEKNREAWRPPQQPAPGDAPAPGQERGVVYFYGIRSSSKRVVFCLDVSGSMDFPLDGAGGKGPPRIEKAKQELVQALNGLPEDAEFTIVVYNAEVRTWKASLDPASPKNKAAARKFVEDLKPEGATNIFDALATSLEIAAPPAKGREPGADTIFFLTDGQPTHGKILDAHQILDEITRRNRTLGVVLHAVGVSKEQNAAFLLNLARRNGGRYVAYK